MMDVDAWLMVGLIAVYVFIFGVIIVAIGLVAGYIASWMGFTGLMWWAVTILFYILIAGIIGVINRIGNK